VGGLAIEGGLDHAVFQRGRLAEHQQDSFVGAPVAADCWATTATFSDDVKSSRLWRAGAGGVSLTTNWCALVITVVACSGDLSFAR
jgi:hypothetical protein